jgi:hypothetical protein
MYIWVIYVNYGHIFGHFGQSCTSFCHQSCHHLCHQIEVVPMPRPLRAGTGQEAASEVSGNNDWRLKMSTDDLGKTGGHFHEKEEAATASPGEQSAVQPESLPGRIHDDGNGLDYAWSADGYYLPDLLPSDGSGYTQGAYARRRLRFIRKHRRALYAELLAAGKLSDHLREIDEQAGQMLKRLTEQKADREGLTAGLKQADQMAWVALANSIRHRAEEIVNDDVIYV